jgi:hypothetical protein
MLTADSGIASRRRLRDGAGAGGTAALGLFVSGFARSSIAEAPLGLSAADGAGVATGAEKLDRSGTVRAGADAPGRPAAIFRKSRVWLGNADSRRVGISFDPTEIDPFEWQALRLFNTTALVGNTAIVKIGGQVPRLHGEQLAHMSLKGHAVLLSIMGSGGA